MRGRIEVESKPGKGTRFTFLVPAIADDVKPDSSAESEDETAHETESQGLASVLLVDDDKSTLELSKRILTRNGYSVITANSGAAGIDLAWEKRPDIIVLDVIMPEMDGWQVLEKLKGEASTKDIPIILQSMLSERELGLAMGADDYLTKPVDKSDLPNAVRKLLPRPNLNKGVLIIEEGSAITTLVEENRGSEVQDLVRTSDLAEASRWFQKREFGIILLGQHSEMDAVSKFMESVERSEDFGNTPMLLLNSIQLETMDSDQLLSFIRVRQGPGEKTAADAGRPHCIGWPELILREFFVVVEELEQVAGAILRKREVSRSHVLGTDSALIVQAARIPHIQAQCLHQLSVGFDAACVFLQALDDPATGRHHHRHAVWLLVAECPLNALA